MGILQMIREKKAERLKARDAKLDEDIARLKPRLEVAKKAEKVRQTKKEIRKTKLKKYKEGFKKARGYLKKAKQRSGGGFGSGLGAGGPFDTGGVAGKKKEKKKDSGYITVKIKK